jgi:hypothetical protein
VLSNVGGFRIERARISSRGLEVDCRHDREVDMHQHGVGRRRIFDAERHGDCVAPLSPALRDLPDQVLAPKSLVEHVREDDDPRHD